MSPYPDDDSCPKCGLVSDDGLAHIVCPSECSTCGCVDVFNVNGCPCCYVWEIYNELSSEERYYLADLIKNS